MADEIEDVSLGDLLDDTIQDPPKSEEPKVEDTTNTGKEDGEGTPKPKTDDTDDTSSDNQQKVKDLFISLNQEDLSDEDKATKQEILNTYKGKGFNENGDIIDENGEVIKTFEEIYTNLNTEDKFDEDGNLIDEEGNIIKTKDQLKNDKSIVNDLHQELGYDFKDDKGNTKTYADSKDGLLALSTDIANRQFQEFQDNFVNQNPVLVDVAKHLALGKSLDTFNQSVDYSKVKVEELSKNSKLNYIRQSLQEKGFSSERIEASLRRVEDGNQIDEELKFALEDLQSNQTKTKAQRDADYQALIDAEQKRVEDYWNDIEQGVNKGTLKGFNIPEAERSNFFDYLAKPVKDGKSQAALDSESQTIEDTLTLEFLKYKKFDLSKYIKNAANTQNATKLSSLINRSLKDKVNKSTTTVKDKNKSPDAVDISTLLGG